MKNFPRGLARSVVTDRRQLLGWALGGVIFTTSCTRSRTIELTGAKLDGRASPDFSLTDQHGKSVSLADFHGKPVALAFLFTRCPDICPLIAAQMRATYELLPENQRDKVAFVGISVDPEGDTPEAIQTFTQQFELDEVPGWHMLTGSRPELEAVWAAYGVEAFEFDNEVDRHLNGSAGVPAIAHTDAIYLIDGDGKQRALLRSDVDPGDLANDLKALS